MAEPILGFDPRSRPTVSQVAVKFGVKAEVVREAARRQNVPIRENRINAQHLNAIDFELTWRSMSEEGVAT